MHIKITPVNSTINEKEKGKRKGGQPPFLGKFKEREFLNVDYCIDNSNPLFQDIKHWYGVIKVLSKQKQTYIH